MNKETADRLVAAIDKCCDQCQELVGVLTTKEWGNPDDKVLGAGIAAILTANLVMMQSLVILAKDNEDGDK